MSRDFPRIYLNADENFLSLKSEILLPQAHIHYLSSVLRLKSGDGVRVFNGRDGEWEGRILEVKKQKIRLFLEKKLKEQHLLKPKTLLFSPLKREATELIYRMGTELGVTCFQPLIMARTNTHRLNLSRLSLITQEAAEQCERLDIPELCDPVPFKSYFATLPKEQYIAVALERAKERGISSLSLKREVEVSTLLVGPEGGFTEGEVSFLKQYPTLFPFSLGHLVLRAETAVVAGLSMLGLMHIYKE